MRLRNDRDLGGHPIMAKTVSTTTLNLGLISCPVKLKVVAESKTTGFKMASPAGNPVKQMYVDEQTGELVGTKADCRSGLFTPDGFVEISDETRKLIDTESKLDSMTIDGFLPLAEAPYERATAAYYLAPGGAGVAAAKPLALLRDGFKAQGVCGYGRVTLTTKTYPFLIFEKDGGLFVTLLVYADEFKQAAEAAEVLAGVETDAKTLALAATLFEMTGGSRDSLDGYVDDRRDRREELVQKALAGEVIEVTAKPEAEATVTDLADMLAASIGAAAPKIAKKPAAKKLAA